MHHRLPYRRPYPRPYPRSAGLVNLVAAAIVGVIIYRKGVDAGKKMAESKKNE
jgi:hypothetical protein